MILRKIYNPNLFFSQFQILNELKFAKIEKTDRCPTAKIKRFVLPLTVDLTQVQNGEDLLYKNRFSVNVKSVSSTRKGIEIQLIPEDLVPETLEFPRLNYEYSGKKYRYLYGLGNEYLHPNKILKIDTESRDVVVWKEPGHFVSEPIFVARNIHLPEQEMEEDDGVVIFTLLNTSPYNTVQLVILDGKTFKELARIKFLTKGEVVEGFHGIFVRRNHQIIRY
uniref:Betacarotene oxygenase 2 [Xenopus laevis] n=1 Tax=Lepeophtheirus salmonis TaxID=72036 RepID=A0A0K2V7I8_LEPSM